MKHHCRSAQVWHVFSRDLTVLPVHPHVHPQQEWAIPAYAFPAIAGTHLPPQMDGRPNRPWCEVAPAEIRTCNLPTAYPALYHTATSTPLEEDRQRGLTVVDIADAASLLPCWPPAFRPVSASEDSMSLDDEVIFDVFDSLGLEEATVTRRDFVSILRSLSETEAVYTAHHHTRDYVTL